MLFQNFPINHSPINFQNWPLSIVLIMVDGTGENMVSGATTHRVDQEIQLSLEFIRMLVHWHFLWLH